MFQRKRPSECACSRRFAFGRGYFDDFLTAPLRGEERGVYEVCRARRADHGREVFSANVRNRFDQARAVERVPPG